MNKPQQTATTPQQTATTPQQTATTPQHVASSLQDVAPAPGRAAGALLRVWRMAISALVVSSLLLNVVLAVVLLGMRQDLREALQSARDALVATESEPLVLDVAVDEDIPIQMTVPIDQVFVVPLEMNYPLKTVINTYITLPVLGRQNISVPVDTVIPVSTTVEVPIRANVPISLTYHLQTEIPVEMHFPFRLSSTLEALIEDLQ